MTRSDDPGPARSGSSSGVRTGLAGLALVGAAALVAASAADVVIVRAARGPSAAATGWDRHGAALVLLALAVVALAVLAWRGARIAAAALIVVGLACLLIAVAGDAPDLGREISVGPAAAAGTSRAGPGFYLETLGGVLAMIAGAGLLLTPDCA